MLGAAARRLAGVVLVDARGAGDGEPPQQLAGGAAERNHGEAAHERDTRIYGGKNNIWGKPTSRCRLVSATRQVALIRDGESDTVPRTYSCMMID